MINNRTFWGLLSDALPEKVGQFILKHPCSHIEYECDKISLIYDFHTYMLTPTRVLSVTLSMNWLIRTHEIYYDLKDGQTESQYKFLNEFGRLSRMYPLCAPYDPFNETNPIDPQLVSVLEKSELCCDQIDE